MDNVTLTINTNLQVRWPRPWTSTHRASSGRPPSVINPNTGAIEAMYSNPTFDPNPLVSQDLATETAAWNANACPPTAPQAQCVPGSPLVPGTYGQVYPPGSTFKVVTTSAVLENRPDLAKMIYPRRLIGHAPQLRNPGPGPDQLPRRRLPSAPRWGSRDHAHPVL